MKLSIILSGIRPQNWLALYQSIPNATALTDYELVIVSPYDLPPELQNVENVRLIKDWGHPTRCYQLSLLHSQGEYVLFVADDGVFCSNLSVDKGFDVLSNYKSVVSFLFTENESLENITPHAMSFCISGHPILKKMKYIPNHYLLTMAFLMRRDYLVEIGGWDCVFESPGISLIDLAVRLQNDGAEVVFGETFMNFTYEIGGNHTPVADAQSVHDIPLLKGMYNSKKNRTQRRTKIDFDSWKNAPEVWDRRFPEGKV